MGGGKCHIFWKKRYEGVRHNVISITRGWVGAQFPGGGGGGSHFLEKRYEGNTCTGGSRGGGGVMGVATPLNFQKEGSPAWPL